MSAVHTEKIWNGRVVFSRFIPSVCFVLPRGVCYSEEDIVYFLVTELDSLVLVRVKACEVGYFIDKREKRIQFSGSISIHMTEQFIKENIRGHIFDL